MLDMLRGMLVAFVLSLILLGAITVCLAEEPLTHPEIPLSWWPDEIALIEESSIAPSMITGLFRSGAGCRIAQYVANEQQGVQALCAPMRWLKALPEELRPRLAPGLVAGH